MAKKVFENRDADGGDEEGNEDGWYIGRRVVIMSSCSSDLRIEDGSGETVLLIDLSIINVRESVVIVSIELAIATPQKLAAGMKRGKEGERF